MSAPQATVAPTTAMLAGLPSCQKAWRQAAARWLPTRRSWWTTPAASCAWSASRPARTAAWNSGCGLRLPTSGAATSPARQSCRCSSCCWEQVRISDCTQSIQGLWEGLRSMLSIEDPAHSTADAKACSRWRARRLCGKAFGQPVLGLLVLARPLWDFQSEQSIGRAAHCECQTCKTGADCGIACSLPAQPAAPVPPVWHQSIDILSTASPHPGLHGCAQRSRGPCVYGRCGDSTGCQSCWGRRQAQPAALFGDGICIPAACVGRHIGALPASIPERSWPYPTGKAATFPAQT